MSQKYLNDMIMLTGCSDQKNIYNVRLNIQFTYCKGTISRPSLIWKIVLAEMHTTLKLTNNDISIIHPPQKMSRRTGI